ANPLKRIAPGIARTIGVAGELIHPPAVGREMTVHANHDALRAETRAERVDEWWIGKRRRVHGNLLRAGIEHGLGLRHRANAARHAERDIKPARHARDPGAIHRAPLRARGDVVEHELVRPLVAIARREIEDIAHDHVVAEANALYDLAVADVEAGDDAFGKN